MPTINEALALALQHHQSGQLQSAEEIYRSILATETNQPDALYGLGLIAFQTGHLDAAKEILGQVAILAPYSADCFSNLGEVYRVSGQFEAAVTSFRRAVELNPQSPIPHFGLGNVFLDQGDFAQAADAFHQTLALKPDSAAAYHNLGIALGELRRSEEALAAIRHAIQLQPNYAEAYGNLGNILRDLCQNEEAVQAYRQALAFVPNLAPVYVNLGVVLAQLGELDEATTAIQQAITINPKLAEAYDSLTDVLMKRGRVDDAISAGRLAVGHFPERVDSHVSLGTALMAKWVLDEAEQCFRKALTLAPDSSIALIGLGNACKDQGKLDEAIEAYRRASVLSPNVPAASGNYLYTLYFSPKYSPQDIYNEHRRWGDRVAEEFAAHIQPHPNDRTPNRRLRIGYVSPDFDLHPVGLFMLPLLEAHDRRNFEIYGYSSTLVPDDLTKRCQDCVDVWRDVRRLSEDQLAELIRSDQIDILVDLTLHMARNHLRVFARKPAPVQVTYLGYVGTTGLTTIDYRLTDPYLDPPDEDDQCYSEVSVRLPETVICFRPSIKDVPEVAPPPVLESGQITFGCLHNFCKVSQPTVDAWARILAAVPSSRLIVHAAEGSHRQAYYALLAERGISQDRVRFSPRVPYLEYMRLHHQIDVALDPFPCGGGTTNCDALWMGVPVISLKGQTAVGRGAYSILSNLDLTDLVATDVSGYVQKAVDLAGDVQRLKELRSTLRQRMQSSPLMNGPRFARHVEAAYREMWQRFCQQ